MSVRISTRRSKSSACFSTCCITDREMYAFPGICFSQVDRNGWWTLWLCGLCWPKSLRAWILPSKASILHQECSWCQGGERFVVAEYRGDQEFMRMLWQHNAMWNAKYVCYQCRATASDGPHSYADVSDNPGWEGTQHTNTSFINVELPPYPCYLAYYIYNFWFSPRRTRPLVSVTFIEDMFGLQCSSRRPITCSQALGFILHQNLLCIASTSALCIQPMAALWSSAIYRTRFDFCRCPL